MKTKCYKPGDVLTVWVSETKPVAWLAEKDIGVSLVVPFVTPEPNNWSDDPYIKPTLRLLGKHRFHDQMVTIRRTDKRYRFNGDDHGQGPYTPEYYWEVVKEDGTV